MPIRLYDEAEAVRRANPPRPEVGGWLARDDRVGTQPATVLTAAVRYPQIWGEQNRILTAEQLWRVYQMCPEVRACINGIARRISTWDWSVNPTIAPHDDRYEAVSEAGGVAKRFLQAPNTDGESWQVLMTKLVIDLLVYDATAAELVSNSAAKTGEPTLQEITMLRGADIRPQVDVHGRLIGYVQDPGFLSSQSITPTGTTDRPHFAPDALVYIRLFPTTATPEGMPLLESLFNEFVTIMRASEHLMRAVDADEVPPGILILGGLMGDAAKSAKAEFQADKGKDHKIRLITTGNPQGLSANWIELRHSPKELTLHESIDQVRRTIWRIFGVAPIEMGETDGAPRAQAQVQVDVTTSHLIEPMLELIASAVNRRILPLLVPAEMVGLLEFGFDIEANATPADELALANTFGALIDRAVMSRNEARHRLGFLPRPGCDILTVTTMTGPVPLLVALGEVSAKVVADPAAVADVTKEEADPSNADTTNEDGGGTDVAVAGEQDDAPGEVQASAPAPTRHGLHQRGRPGHDHGPRWRSVKDLPSEWQSPSRTKGKRTLHLRKLGDVVVEYASTVASHWVDMRAAVLADVVAATRDGRITVDEQAALSARFGGHVDTLATKWSIATEPKYTRAAKVGSDAAREMTHAEPITRPEDRGRLYHQRAMSWLTGPDGPMQALRHKLIATMHGAELARARPVGAAMGVTKMPVVVIDGVGEFDVDALINAAASAVDSEEYRIDNWSGRLVDLANQAATDDMLANGAPPVDQGPPAAGDEGASVQRQQWYVEWVTVGDERTCPTCRVEGAAGIVQLSALKTVPGGATECGARCRCVLVYWSAAEVASGEAVSLSPNP